MRERSALAWFRIAPGLTGAILLLAAGPAWALEITCKPDPIRMPPGATECSVCPQLSDLVLLDDPSLDPNAVCALDPAGTQCPFPLGGGVSVVVVCTTPTTVGQKECTFDVVDDNPPRIECPDVEIACGAPLGEPPFQTRGTSACYAVESSCLVEGATWDPGLVVSSSRTYTCTATIVGRPSGPNTAQCSGNILAGGTDSLVIEPFPGPTPLWPPNHKMRSFNLTSDCVQSARLVNSCSGSSVPVPVPSLSGSIRRIESSEPEDDSLDEGSNLQGDGRTCSDLRILPQGAFELRAERSANSSSGRTYRVYFDVIYVDPSSGTLSASGTCSYAVPHSLNQPATVSSECRSCVGTACPCPQQDPACGQ